MGFGNVSERRSAPPQVGVSVVILALGPEGDTGNSAADSGNAANSAHSRLWLPLVKRVRQPFLGCWALPGGDLRSDRSLEQSAYAALESTTDLPPRYLEQLYTFGGPTWRTSAAKCLPREILKTPGRRCAKAANDRPPSTATSPNDLSRTVRPTNPMVTTSWNCPDKASVKTLSTR